MSVIYFKFLCQISLSSRLNFWGIYTISFNIMVSRISTFVLNLSNVTIQFTRILTNRKKLNFGWTFGKQVSSYFNSHVWHSSLTAQQYLTSITLTLSEWSLIFLGGGVRSMGEGEVWISITLRLHKYVFKMGLHYIFSTNGLWTSKHWQL